MLDKISNHRLFPAWIRKQLISDWNQQGFKKYFTNTGWMFAAKIATFITSFLTTAIIARYLGPNNLGKLDYAQSFVAILSVFASLGIDQVLYRDLIAHPEKEKEYLGTAIIAKLFFGTLSFIIAIITSHFVDNQPILTILIGIVSLSFIIGPFGTVSIFFNAEVKAKYSSYIGIFLAFFLSGLKLLIVFLDKGIIYFAIVLALESLITTIWLIYVYITKFNRKPLAWKFNLEVFKQLMADSWPLLVAGLSGYIYAKMDQVLILHYINATSVGIYSAAVKLTQIWAFLPGLLITSLFPAIVNARKTSLISYVKRFRSLALLSIGSTLAIALPLYIFAPFVIHIVYGDAFMASVSILHIYLWVSVVITILVLSQQFLIAENFSKIFLYTGLIGATVNVIVNIILIPIYGTTGSAIGTLISYSLAAISILFFQKSRTKILEMLRVIKNGLPSENN